MPKRESTHEEMLESLRQRAEAIAHTNNSSDGSNATMWPVSEPLSMDAMRRTLHELQVFQIELEMQNDELRSAQVMLDEERTRYQDLYDMSPVGYLTLGQGGEILQTNLKAASLMGVPRSQLVNKPLLRFIAKVDRDAHYLFIQQILRNQQADQRDVQMVNAAGLTFWVHMAVTVQEKGVQETAEREDDSAQCLLVIINDISDRKQAEEKLYESEEIHRSLFNSIDEGFCIIEMVFDDAKKPIDYRHVAINPSFEKQSGLLNAQGRLVSELLPGLERYWVERYGKVALTGEPVRMTQRAEALDRWFDLYAFPTGPKDRYRVGVVFTDVTERKQAEADRAFLDQVLQHKNAELHDAQVLAEKANLAKSDFLSSMSHELRTPLTAILGFAQLMDGANPAPSPAQKRSLEQILKAGWYLLELISEILDLAVVESGKLKLAMQSVSLAGVLLECEAMVEVDAKRRGISLTFEPVPSMAYVQADRTRLKQALINLLSNAIKYNTKGGSVILRFNAENPKRIRMCIEDTGLGLSAEKISQLFQPFNRLGQESRSEPGTGIGLVKTKQLVELMGGSIGVNSTEGKGSTFWIEMKRVSDVDLRADFRAGADEDSDARTDEVREANEKANASEEQLAHLRAEAAVKAGLSAAEDAAVIHISRRNQAGLYTLLYVEDNAANLLLVQELMARRPDVRLITARDGASGLALARSALPDVVLLDTHLPVISGLDLLRILTNDPLTARIPVVVLSASAMQVDIRAGMDAGCFQYLSKPTQIKELMHTLNVALKLEHNAIASSSDFGKLSQLGELT
jgi:PAS domain S-box-containing protein